jgi:hypothetical protein
VRTPEQQQALETAAAHYESLPVDRKGEMNIYMNKKFGLFELDAIDQSIDSVVEFIAQRNTQQTTVVETQKPAKEILPEQGDAPTFFESIATPLVARGWKVAPCYPKKKQVHTALVPRPLEMQSNDPAQIRAWGLIEPNANVCVYAEQVEGGLCFVDKDGAISLVEKYERETCKTFPRTLLVCSSVVEDPNGGTYSKGHWYFLQTPRTIALSGNISEKKTDGLFSFRVHNEYVTSIGSVHPITGRPYFVYDETPVIPMPDDFLDWLQKQVVEEKPKPVAQSVERRLVPRGQMHSAIVTEAGRLRHAGYESKDIVEIVVNTWAPTNLERGYDEAKVRKEATDVARRYDQGEYTGIEFSQKPDPQPTGNMVVTRMSSFEKKKLKWLWNGRIPAGALCTLAGDPDVGKSLVTLYVAACVTRGFPFHGDDQPTPQGEVLILSAEDDPENTLAPRLEAALADLDRVHLLQSVMVKDGAGKTVSEREAQLDQDITAITQVLDQNPRIRLVIIDPISSFLGESAPMHKEQEVRRVLAPLVKKARSSNLVVLLVAHFNKNTETKSAMDRVGGAKAIVGLGRSAWTCVREPKSDEPQPEGAIEQGERFLFLKLKGNLAPSRIGGLVYTIRTRLVEVDDDGVLTKEDIPVIQFLEDTTSTAQEVVIDGKKTMGRPKKVTGCEEWLKEYLAAKGGYDRSGAILGRGNDAGYSDMTIRRANATLQLETVWINRVMYWGFKNSLPTPENSPAEHGGTRAKAGRKKRNTVDLEAAVSVVG